MRAIGVIGTGYYVPERILTNYDLEKTLDTSNEWIVTKTGIKERRIAERCQATSDLALFAANRALINANLLATDIDLIVLATSTPDTIQPATAAIVQGSLGALNAVAFDVSAVCTGFIYAIAIAHSMMLASKTYSRALVIGADTYSRILDWKDRKTCVYFGDGAGAAILGDVHAGLGIKSIFLKTDGRGANVIRFAAGGFGYSANMETSKVDTQCRFEMDGRKVWEFAIKAFPEAVRTVVGKAGVSVKDVSKLISHQANINIIKHSMADLGLSMDKTYTNLDKYGNTSSASIPIALSEAHAHGFFSKGDNLVLVGFGGGLTSGAVYMKWALD